MSALSPYLQLMVKERVITRDVALAANQLATEELQEQAVELWEADGVERMEEVVRRMLTPARPATVRNLKTEGDTMTLKRFLWETFRGLIWAPFLPFYALYWVFRKLGWRGKIIMVLALTGFLVWFLQWRLAEAFPQFARFQQALPEFLRE